MTLPPVNPSQTASGIALDPQTLERVIPESRRPDGSVRKQLKIRPGFTPQEDVRRFRGTKQAEADARQLPKGHIIGWTPPPEKSAEPTKPMSKSQKKNAKRRGKKKEDAVADNWEDEEGDEEEPAPKPAGSAAPSGTHTPEKPNWAAAPDALTTEMDKLKIK
ncbi:RNA binding protein [Mycena chlorophos]|uniref:RNA binding protein n=1 Tax=Mycena chlorophos TaxID=658473 RepID=A0A8H6WG93_MYCCL|nr:RNA binding protein [Mycena chlorophos]